MNIHNYILFNSPGFYPPTVFFILEMKFLIKTCDDRMHAYLSIALSDKSEFLNMSFKSQEDLTSAFYSSIILHLLFLFATPALLNFHLFPGNDICSYIQGQELTFVLTKLLSSLLSLSVHTFYMVTNHFLSLGSPMHSLGFTSCGESYENSQKILASPDLCSQNIFCIFCCCPLSNK